MEILSEYKTIALLKSINNKLERLLVKLEVPELPDKEKKEKSSDCVYVPLEI